MIEIVFRPWTRLQPLARSPGPETTPSAAVFSLTCAPYTAHRGRPSVRPRRRPHARLARLRPVPPVPRPPVQLVRRLRPHGLLARPVRLHAPVSRLPVGRRERLVPQAWLLLPPDALRPPDRRGRGWHGISPASPSLRPRRRSADLAGWGARSFSYSNLVSSGSDRGRPVIGWINQGQRASNLCRYRCHGDGVWQARHKTGARILPPMWNANLLDCRRRRAEIVLHPCGDCTPTCCACPEGADLDSLATALGHRPGIRS